MCDQCGVPSGWAPDLAQTDRRQFLSSAGALAAAATIGGAAGLGPGARSRRSAANITPKIDLGGGYGIVARSAWASADPTGPIIAEEDVRFLLVHHTVTSNTYSKTDVPSLIGGFFGYHTGPEKEWADVAYNFLVDRFGGIWEGRAGSIAGPVRGSATGGSQGFALLASFIGDHRSSPPTDSAREAMARLLAWLGERHALDTAAGATTSFVSRGSSLHPAGTMVTTPTIEGHRAMSATTCPGDAAYDLVRNWLPERVTAIRAAGGLAGTAPATTSTTTAETGDDASQRTGSPDQVAATATTSEEAATPEHAATTGDTATPPSTNPSSMTAPPTTTRPRQPTANTATPASPTPTAPAPTTPVSPAPTTPAPPNSETSEALLPPPSLPSSTTLPTRRPESAALAGRGSDAGADGRARTLLGLSAVGLGLAALAGAFVTTVRRRGLASAESTPDEHLFDCSDEE